MPLFRLKVAPSHSAFRSSFHTHPAKRNGGVCLPLSQRGVAALPAGWIYVVVVDVLLGGRAGGRAAAAAAAAAVAARSAHLHLFGLVGVGHRGAVGQVAVVAVGGGVQLRSHLLVLLLLARQRQCEDLITHRQPGRELGDLLGLFQRFWE